MPMSNRLAAESSAYLRQHAENPVDWYPWGEEALAKARAEDKPILLSVGYSACHWCHVMAHESFEDPAVAEVMNRHYVNIKVDREERPDLDQIYQTAHQMLAQRAGGWPLTMFLAPDGSPFWGGTYFPRTARYGMPGFVDLLERIAQVWREHMEIRLQRACDEIPTAAVIAPAVHQQQQRRIRVAPVRVVQPQTLRVVEMTLRLGHERGHAPVTRQITSPTSSATSSELSGPIETPTGRP